MSWVTGEVTATLDDLVALHPTVPGRLATMRSRLWETPGLPPRVLELVRVRVAQLLGCEAEPTRDVAGARVIDRESLARWHDCPRFDAADRACLAVAEQFVIDPHAVTDDQIDAVRGQLGDAGAVGLFVALALFEGLARARLVLGVGGQPADDRGGS